MRTIKRKRLENSNDVEIECNSLLDEHSSTKRQSPNNVSSSINQQQQHQELSPPDDQNICSGQESPPSTNDFKTPLPVTNDHFNIRRKSNRILSLKRLNQSLQQQNSNLVTSSTSDHNDLQQQQQQAQISECDQNSIPAFDTGQKPNQTSDISSTALNNNEANSNCNQIKNSSSTTTSVTTANTSNSNSGKSLRKIQAWTEDDIRWFFEALGEHGKDFPHIQSYIASRCEKKGIAPEMIKNYEQVRHFYYRMWHKISQLLKISANVDKGIQEIYGLINYGEIWKRFGPKFDCRLNVSLQQLVDYGYTVVKMKGKNVRIRTPVCNALKKIHNIDNKINKPATQPSMPKEIQIELIPATNSDWIRVHSLAQNPRLRTKLSMQQRLSTLISYLEKRWNPNRLLNNDLIDQSSLNNDNCRIRLRAQNSARLCDVTLKSTANSISYHSYRSTTHGTGQIDVSLSAYLKNTFNDANSLMKKSKMNKKTAAAAAKKSTNISMDTNGLTAISKDSNIECCECPNVDNNNKDERNEKDDDNGNDPQPIDLFKLLDSMNEELEVSPRNHYMNDKNKSYSEWKNDYEQESITNSTQSVNDIDDDDIRLPEPPSNQTLAQWLSGGGDIDDEDDDSGVGSVDVNKPILNDDLDGDNESSQKNISDNDQSIKITDISKSNRKRSCTKDLTETVEMLTAEQALIGWTLNEGKMVTIGELYLLFCQPEKITLEYSWIVVDEKDSLVCDEIQSKPLNTLKKFLIAAEMTLMNYKKSTNNNNNNLSISSSNLRKRQANKNSTTTTTTNTITNQQQPNSQLLSNLIQETILNDNVTNNPEQSSNQNDDNISDEDGRNSKPIIATKSGHSSKSNLNKSSCLVSNENGEKIKTIKNNRTTAVLVDDPHKIDEVLKELKIRGRRAGRPVNKFMYNNHHPNKILNMNGNSLSQPQPTSKSTVLLTVRASNLRQSVDGTIPKQIVLTAMTNDVKNPEKSSSVLIPIQLETAAKSSSSTTTDSTTYFQLMPSTQNLSIQTDSTVTMTEMDKTNEWFSNSTQDGSFLLSNDYHPLQSSSSSMVKTVEPVLVPLAPLPTDIETHMNTFAEDNSIDLMAKFADLAEQITSTDGGKSIH
uniref:Probable serine/threonine-protein kinase DDB_G0282963 n=1 Tax=Dermatophagoides pteronyssinus TaxID=6956 RepID=A0A6P6XT07_DERPT|nr:probable serine/threonine-protein kinase DDB_G0282963 [Dermatophagoides pteronyssinus]